MSPQVRRGGIIIAFMTLLASLFALAIINVLYTTSEIEDAKEQIRVESAKNERNQCEIISLSTKPRPIPPVPPFDPQTNPETEFGRDINRYIRDKQAYDKAAEKFAIEAARALRAYSDKIGCGKS